MTDPFFDPKVHPLTPAKKKARKIVVHHRPDGLHEVQVDGRTVCVTRREDHATLVAESHAEKPPTRQFADQALKRVIR